MIDHQKRHILKPVIDGQDYLISRTTWQCEYIDSEDQEEDCPYMEDEPTTLIQTTKFIPADYSPPDRKMKYTLTLETANEDSTTGFDKLTECSITL